MNSVYSNQHAESSRESRCDHAVESAAKMFLEQGIEHVKMSDIALQTGVGVATLYRYFGTKTGIAVAAMTKLWRDLREKFSGVFDSEVFRSQTGYKQVYDLLRMYLVLYTAHSDFMKLLGEFDLLLAQEKDTVPEEALNTYAQSILNFYPVFETAYLTGVADGTVRELPDVVMFYVSTAHSFMELSKKLLQGELIPTDDFSHGERELEIMIETVAYFLKKQ